MLVGMKTTTNIKGWNQAGQGNAYVSDGAERYWAEFPAGTSAQAVLDDYMSTADYSWATEAFFVTAEIGDLRVRVRVQPV
jgi:hypothetical protein